MAAQGSRGDYLREGGGKEKGRGGKEGGILW